MNFNLWTQPNFMNQMMALPPADQRLVTSRVQELTRDPRPDGDHKKKLKKYKGTICRIRAGDYRVVYSYGDGWVQLLAVRPRKDVYDDDYFADEEPPDLDAVVAGGKVERVPVWDGQDASKGTIAAEAAYLPVKIDEDLLRRLRVPDEFHAALIACRTEDELLNAPVPQAILDRMIEVATDGHTLEQVLAQPTYVVPEEDDLVRYAEGELLGFLLKLNPEQERLVDWGMGGSGPTLVKGGPGTGKSTVALYRAQAMVRALQAAGVARPRILFTTYTNALVTASQQLLERLLGKKDAGFVEVRTADNLVMTLLNSLGIRRDPLNSQQVRDLIVRARATAAYPGDPAAGRAAIDRLTPEYLAEEFGAVIEGYDLDSLAEYLAARRVGRRVGLNETQRRAVWAVYERFNDLLDENGWTTFHRQRRHALRMVRAGAGPRHYDGVVIDEAQDLDPTVLRLLVELCAAPNRLFIAADANQSIYGSTFRWSDVHEDLRVRGRTGVLRRNHRSTREIGEAAESYLRSGWIDDEETERQYETTGAPPAYRTARTPDEECTLLHSFFTQSNRFVRLGRGAFAVLCPTNRAAEEIAARLTDAGLPAEYMAGTALDLEKPTVKVLNLRSAKGLEFPIVALAGFVENPGYGLVRGATAEEQEERMEKDRRTLFVGMTRAMRTLMVVAPPVPHPLFAGFDAAHWNIRQEEVAV